MKLLRALHRQRGQALVEFSLVAIVFFILVLGVIDVGRAVLNYNTLAQAAREGTRYAIVHGANSSQPSGPGGAYYTPPGTDTQVTQTVQKFASGLNQSDLTVEAQWTDGNNQPGSHVKVTSSYTYHPFFNFLGLVSFSMTSASTMAISN